MTRAMRERLRSPAGPSPTSASIRVRFPEGISLQVGARSISLPGAPAKHMHQPGTADRVGGSRRAIAAPGCLPRAEHGKTRGQGPAVCGPPALRGCRASLAPGSPWPPSLPGWPTACPTRCTPTSWCCPAGRRSRCRRSRVRALPTHVHDAPFVCFPVQQEWEMWRCACVRCSEGAQLCA